MASKAPPYQRDHQEHGGDYGQKRQEEQEWDRSRLVGMPDFTARRQNFCGGETRSNFFEFARQIGAQGLGLHTAFIEP